MGWRVTDAGAIFSAPIKDSPQQDGYCFSDSTNVTSLREAFGHTERAGCGHKRTSPSKVRLKGHMLSQSLRMWFGCPQAVKLVRSVPAPSDLLGSAMLCESNSRESFGCCFHWRKCAGSVASRCTRDRGTRLHSTETSCYLGRGIEDSVHKSDDTKVLFRRAASASSPPRRLLSISLTQAGAQLPCFPSEVLQEEQRW